MAATTQPVYQGWFVEPLDDRDKMYVAPKGLTVQPHVNLWDQKPEARVPVYDQGQTNTCVANATAAALWYELKLSSQKAVDAAGGPSRLFIYWNARVSQLLADAKTVPSDDGCFCRRAMRSLEQKGDCNENGWPFVADKTLTPPTPEAYTQAEEYKIHVYWRLDPARPVDHLTDQLRVDDGQATLLSVKQCLSEGYPIVFGFWAYSKPMNFIKHADGTWMLPDVWADGKIKPHDKPGNFGGHAVLMIGYDDVKEVAICQNSWGESTATPGAPIFYLPYRWILDYEATSDFWTIRRN